MSSSDRLHQPLKLRLSDDSRSGWRTKSRRPGRQQRRRPPRSPPQRRLRLWMVRSMVRLQLARSQQRRRRYRPRRLSPWWKPRPRQPTSPRSHPRSRGHRAASRPLRRSSRQSQRSSWRASRRRRAAMLPQSEHRRLPRHPHRPRAHGPGQQVVCPALVAPLAARVRPAGSRAVRQPRRTVVVALRARATTRSRHRRAWAPPDRHHVPLIRRARAALGHRPAGLLAGPGDREHAQACPAPTPP